ncbi:MAG TPA: phasin family protein [Nitrospirota bacterium]|nr:phasin family protein [Nitrospirota bacterium]
MMVSEVIKKAMLVGLGAQEKAKEFIDELVKAGELSKSEGATLVKEWVSKAEESTKDMDHKVKDAIGAAFEKFNIPTRDDLASLEKKIQSLSARLAKLEGGDGKDAD